MIDTNIASPSWNWKGLTIVNHDSARTREEKESHLQSLLESLRHEMQARGFELGHSPLIDYMIMGYKGTGNRAVFIYNHMFRNLKQTQLLQLLDAVQSELDAPSLNTLPCSKYLWMHESQLTEDMLLELVRYQAAKQWEYDSVEFANVVAVEYAPETSVIIDQCERLVPGMRNEEHFDRAWYCSGTSRYGEQSHVWIVRCKNNIFQMDKTQFDNSWSIYNADWSGYGTLETWEEEENILEDIL